MHFAGCEHLYTSSALQSVGALKIKRHIVNILHRKTLLQQESHLSIHECLNRIMKVQKEPLKATESAVYVSLPVCLYSCFLMSHTVICLCSDASSRKGQKQPPTGSIMAAEGSLARS